MQTPERQDVGSSMQASGGCSQVTLRSHMVRGYFGNHSYHIRLVWGVGVCGDEFHRCWVLGLALPGLVSEGRASVRNAAFGSACNKQSARARA